MTKLMALALALGAFTVVATAVGVARRLPYEFGGTGSPDNVAGDAFLHGTGISAPLVFVALMIALAYVAGRAGRIGVVAAVVLAVLGAVGIVAGLLEPALGKLDPLVTPVAVLGIGLAVLLVAGALRSAFDNARNGRPAA